MLASSRRGAGSAGGGVVGGGGLQGGGGGVGGERGGVDERTADRAGLHGLVQGAALEELRPAEEPLGPAVVPGAALRAAHDRDRVAGHGQVVVRLGVGGRQVDAAVADVLEALLADG